MIEDSHVELDKGQDKPSLSVQVSFVGISSRETYESSRMRYLPGQAALGSSHVVMLCALACVENQL